MAEHGPMEPRCIDCIPFQQMGERVERLENRVSDLGARIGSVDDRLTTVEAEVRTNGRDVRRLVSWLLGNGKNTGFQVEWAVFKARVDQRFSLFDRMKYIALGVLVTGGITGAVAAIRAAIVRGIL